MVFMNGIKYHLKNLRIFDIQPYSMIGIFGYLLGLENLTNIDILNFILFCIGLNLIISFTFSINNVSDYKTDKKKGNNPISQGKLKVKEALVSSILSLILGLALFFFIGINQISIILSIVIAILGFLYSFRPFRFKERFGIDILSHGIFLGTLPFLIGYLNFVNTINLDLIFFTIFFFISSSIYLTQHTVSDYKNDLRTRTKTLSTKFGLNFSRIILISFALSAVIISILLSIFKNDLLLLSVGYVIALFYFIKGDLTSQVYSKILILSCIIFLFI